MKSKMVRKLSLATTFLLLLLATGCTVPHIYAISIADITDTTATITWKTRKPATTQVQFGETSAYNRSLTPSKERTLDHTMTVTELKPETIYHLIVTSADLWGNEAVSEDLRFRTRPPQACTESLWKSLKRFEQWVVTQEDASYGYVGASGYPNYLYSFGKMYLYLYKYTRDDYYKDKFDRVLYYIEAVRNNDWSWSSPSGETSVLYNCFFAELFIDAWRETLDPSYLETAKSSLEFLYEREMKGAYNDQFYTFVAIANYASKSRPDISLLELGLRAYNFSFDGYDDDTGRWFYYGEEKAADFYDGHSAYYQLWLMQLVLEFEEEIRSVYPEQHAQLVERLPTMMQKVSEYVLPSGGFYYKEESPDSTESLAINLVAYELYDNRFDTNHRNIKQRCRKTILERQAPCGAFYKAGNVIEIHYTDEVGQYLSQYLYLTGE